MSHEPLSSLPENLNRTARNLEERFHLLRFPTRKAAQADWEAVPSAVRFHILEWIQVLMAHFNVLNGVLEYGDSQQTGKKSPA